MEQEPQTYIEPVLAKYTLNAEQEKNESAKTETTATVAKKVDEKPVVPDPPKKTVEVKPTKQTTVVVIPANTNGAVTKNINPAVAKEPGESYFATDFIATSKNSKLKKVTGDALTFKTASGWIDKKYYVLMNNAPAGTIVKITAENGNSIFAKVLWQLEDMKLNQGIGFRISESAAAALSIAFVKFPLTVEYHP